MQVAHIIHASCAAPSPHPNSTNTGICGLNGGPQSAEQGLGSVRELGEPLGASWRILEAAQVWSLSLPRHILKIKCILRLPTRSHEQTSEH